MAPASARILKVRLTFRYRVRDKHSSDLNRQARAVNIVWNYCNEIQREAVRRHRPWLGAYDLQRLTAGSGEDLDVHAHTVQRVCSVYASSRAAKKKPWLRFRGGKSLGWVPFNTGHVSFRSGAFVFRGRRYDVWLSRELPKGAKLGAGTFSQDARGRWYINIPMETEAIAVQNNAAVGIDLGVKYLAACSNGEKAITTKAYHAFENVLRSAQRANKRKVVAKTHRRIANRRRNYLHEVTTSLSKRFALIFVGDVAASRIAKTHLAKSVLDAGWADFKRMLSYKTLRYGGRMVEVSEIYSSQTCSTCGSKDCESRPRGIAGLGIREWDCEYCGTRHDRDVNAARNILRLGLQSLGGGAEG